MIIAKKDFFRVSMGLATALIVTAFLFAGLPLFTQIQVRQKNKSFESPIMLMATKPPKPPPVEKDRKKLEKPDLSKALKKNPAKESASKPKMDVSGFELAEGVGGIAGQVSIGSPGTKDFKGLMGQIGFELSDVDEPPKVVRKFPPAYPFAAKRSGVTGEVIIRCLIKENGEPARFEVFSSQPKGVFEESAMDAVMKWRFKPGILGGDPVPTWVKIPFKFELQ